jgi:Domain of unknown function (DUF4260)
MTTPRVLVRLEGLALALTALILFARSGGGWGGFALLILAPDLGILGYIGGPRLGAITYNLLHTYVLPLALVFYGYFSGALSIQHVALIWLAHISIDRTLGFGLKYGTAFRDSHLGRL